MMISRSVFVPQPLNDRDPPMSPNDFWKVSSNLENAIRTGARKAVQDGKITKEDARKFFWSGKFIALRKPHCVSQGFTDFYRQIFLDR